jgi:hypothetical protein
MSELLEHRDWALVDDTGFLDDVYEDASLEDAMAYARQVACGEVVLDTIYEVPEEPHALAANPQRLSVMQQASFRASGMPRVRHRDVEALSLEEAHAKLAPFFPTAKATKKGTETAVVKWQDPEKMAEGLLRDNYKQQKRHPTRKSLISTGLPLAPNAIAYHRMGETQGPSRRAPQGDQSLTFCAGSNEFCRGSCLVYTGQHAADPYNLKLKVATSVALVSEPTAFMRMLVENIERFGREQRQCRKVPCYRLNVLSDLPWELIYPELFERFGRDQFYDYTKVENRRVPGNYDLTFSFSGTNWKRVTGRGADHCQRELDRGVRVAVVFFARRAKDYPLPSRFQGYDVIDGTTHDFRFTDPGGIVVGLRYLTPSTQLLTTTPKRSARALAARQFLVPCWVTDEGDVVAAETPRSAEAYWFD